MAQHFMPQHRGVKVRELSPAALMSIENDAVAMPMPSGAPDSCTASICSLTGYVFMVGVCPRVGAAQKAAQCAIR